MNFVLAFLLAANIIVPAYNYTEEDVKILGDVAWLENGHTGKTEFDNQQCILMTMAVVKNRMKSSDKWLHLKGDNTVYDVVYAKGQYAKVTLNNIGKTDTPDWVYKLAEEVLIFDTNVPDYVIYQSTQKNLGTNWKVISGEYFSTSGGHYMEGKDIIIETNKQKYLQQSFVEFKKKVAKVSKRTIISLQKYFNKIKIMD